MSCSHSAPPLNFGETTVSLPQPTGPQPTAFASGVESDDLELKLGLNVLQNALAGLGVKMLDGGKLEASYRNAKSVKFKIDKPFSVSIELLALSNYLKGRTLDWSNDLVKRYFLDEDRDVFIITEVLKSQNFSITAADAQNANVDVDVSLLKGAVSGNLNIQPVKTDSTQELQFGGEISDHVWFQVHQGPLPRGHLETARCRCVWSFKLRPKCGRAQPTRPTCCLTVASCASANRQLPFLDSQ